MFLCCWDGLAQSRENEYILPASIFSLSVVACPIKAILVSAETPAGDKKAAAKIGVGRWQANMPMSQSNAMRGEKRENVTESAEEACPCCCCCCCDTDLK